MVVGIFSDLYTTLLLLPLGHPREAAMAGAVVMVVPLPIWM